MYYNAVMPKFTCTSKHLHFSYYNSWGEFFNQLFWNGAYIYLILVDEICYAAADEQIQDFLK